MKTLAGTFKFFFFISSLFAFHFARATAPTCDNPMAATVKTATQAIAVAASAGTELSQAELQKLNRVAWSNATKRRRVASFLGGGYRSGNVSKGMCSQAVQETLHGMGINMPRGNAINQKSWLHSHMKPIAEGRGINQNLCRSSTPGIVCLYSTTRHSYGHIEVKAANNRYCSDFCSGHPSGENKKGKFTLVGVYRITK